MTTRMSDTSLRPRRLALGALALACGLASFAASAATADVAAVVEKLNNEPALRVTDRNKSYRTILDAYLDMTPPPMPVGPGFDVVDVHPGMPDWEKVSAWAAANTGMADALVAARDALSFGLPYGAGNVDATYRNAGLVAEIGDDSGDLRVIRFPYLDAARTIAVFGTADMFRLAEAGDFDRAFKVATSLDRFLRTLCDRPMLAEKVVAFELLADALSVQRDAMYMFRDQIPVPVLQDIAKSEYPFLRPDRKRLEMPEGERIVAEAVLESVFDDRGQAEPDRFADVFGVLQSSDKPLTRFGAAKRWKRIAEVHGSLDSSLKKLTDIYDDWWRRWRMREYDPMQDLPTEFSRANPIRYGAVIYSIQDIATLFELRRRLVAEVNGAAMTAAILGFRSDFDTLPDDREKAYAVYGRKISDADPWDRQYGRFLYRWLGSQRKAVDTPNGRVWVDGGVLYARGADQEDGNFDEHTPDGTFGDMILFPPMRVLEREQGVAP